jgi:hypothetical protein
MTHQLETLPPHESLDPPFDPNLLIIFARFSEQPQILSETIASCFDSQGNAATMTWPRGTKPLLT